MKTTRILLALTSLYWTQLAFAAPDTADVAKQEAALQTCLTEAQKRYGSVAENSEPKKKKIGKIRGHAYQLQVGASSKQVNCIANARGKSMFYSGRI